MKRVIFRGALAAVLIMALDAHGGNWHLENNESARAEDGAWSSVTNAYSWVNDAGCPMILTRRPPRSMRNSSR